MLIEFSVENYKSFKERVTLSMVAANLVSEDHEIDENNTFKVNDDLSLLKSAAIYGANASGKSNFVEAMKFMKNFVLNSSKDTQVTETISVEPFLLNIDSRENPSLFEIVFLMDSAQYRYGFEVDTKHVVAEWLFRAQTTREAKLFIREGQDISLGTAFKEGKGLQDRTRSNSLFLSVAAQFNGTIAQNVLSWLSSLIVNSGLQDDEFGTITLDYLKDESLSKQVLAFLSEFDLGFSNLRIANAPPNVFLNDVERQSDPITRRINELMRSVLTRPKTRLETEHYVRDGENKIVESTMFAVDYHESQGTRKLIALAGPLLRVLANGTAWLIDEFDARLHPLITRKLINIFNSKDINPNGAQLIFVTHDTNLLDKILFRRDQVWFVAKDRQDATHLTSLAEFKVRNDAAYEKNYLHGRYGGIPFLTTVERWPAEVVHG